MRTALLILVATLDAAGSARVNMLPRLSRLVEQDIHSKPHSQPQPPPLQLQYSVVAALDSATASMLGSLFGTCFPIDDQDSDVHAELCTSPLPTSPALIVLAPSKATISLGALALSDVWVLALPSNENSANLDSMLEQLVDALSQLPEPTARTPPRRLLVVTQQAPSEAQQSMAAYVRKRLNEMQAHRCSSGNCPLLASLINVQSATLSLPAHGSGACSGGSEGSGDSSGSGSGDSSGSGSSSGSSSGGSGVGEAAQGDGDGPALLARFLQPECTGYLLGHEGRAASVGVSLRDAPALLDLLLRTLPPPPPRGGGGDTTSGGTGSSDTGSSDTASSDTGGSDTGGSDTGSSSWPNSEGEWGALMSCERACHAACELALECARTLREELADAALNPPRGRDFLQRLERLSGDCRDTYARATAPWATSAARAHYDAQLAATCDAQLLELACQHLDLLLNDALAGYRGQLALLMASSAEGAYRRSARRLSRHTSKDFQRDAQAAAPQGGCFAPETAEAVRAAAARGLAELEAAMAAEAESHEEEAEVLPPREQDVGPPPWWKQILIQILGAGLNLGQAYLLQHLPARRRDRLDEQAVPRAPLF